MPVANPANAGAMALLAACITPLRVGRMPMHAGQEHDNNDLITTTQADSDRAEFYSEPVGLFLRIYSVVDQEFVHNWNYLR